MNDTQNQVGRQVAHDEQHTAHRGKVSMPKRKTQRGAPTRAAAKPGSNLAAISRWKERLRYAVTSRGRSGRQIAKEAGIAASTLRHLLGGKSESVEIDTLARLADALRVKVEYLVAGVHAVVDATQTADPKNVVIIPRWTTMELGTVDVPSSSAYIPLRAANYPDDIQALIVSDQSMVPEGLNQPPPPATIVIPGDTVLFSKKARMEPGQLVVALTPRGAIVRRCAFDESNGMVRLLSNNHLYPTVSVKPQKILGVVVAVAERRLAETHS